MQKVDKGTKDNLTKILSEPKISLSEERINDIRKNFSKSRDRFLNPKIKKIRENLLRNKKNKKRKKNLCNDSHM